MTIRKPEGVDRMKHELQELLNRRDSRIAELEKALDNCRLLAMRKAHREPSTDWEHIIRFCTEAGRGPSPLRADS